MKKTVNVALDVSSIATLIAAAINSGSAIDLSSAHYSVTGELGSTEIEYKAKTPTGAVFYSKLQEELTSRGVNVTITLVD